MADFIEITVPDIGGFHDVEIIEVLIKPGDTVAKEQTLITLESEKSSLEVPAPFAGVIGELRVKIGDKISMGSPICTLQAIDQPTASVSGQASTKAPAPAVTPARAEPPTRRAPVGVTNHPVSEARPPASAPSISQSKRLVVIGAGPGGYTAAFRAADLGMEVTLIERHPNLGGVCLNVGCIPSKALLHAAKLITEAQDMASHGVVFGKPTIDTANLRQWKNSVVGRLTSGLAQLAKQRKVKVMQGTASFEGPNQLRVDGETSEWINFDQAILATGSRSVKLPFLPEDARVMYSTEALEISQIPEQLLIMGGGVIGMEMATLYAALGSRVSVVEMADQLLPGADADLVRPLQKITEKREFTYHLGTKVTAVEPTLKGLVVTLSNAQGTQRLTYDRVLVAVGRRPNSDTLNLDKANVQVDNRGLIPVDRQLRTHQSHIFAIGDLIAGPMLAHKASHEGKIAAEAAAGHKAYNDIRVIPAVCYSDPEVAWTGLTEREAKAQGLDVGKGVFPWAANGRSLGMGRDEGLTKMLFDKKTDRLLGAAAVGPNAGDLIGELSLAIEMGCVAEDIALTVHAHPTLSETIAMASEAYLGTLTDLYLPKTR